MKRHPLVNPTHAVADPPNSPKFQRLPVVLRERPYWSRSNFYRTAAANPGLLRKMGKSGIVDIAMLDAVEAALPIAEIKPDPTRNAPAVAAPAPSPQPVRRQRRSRQPELVAPSEF